MTVNRTTGLGLGVTKAAAPFKSILFFRTHSPSPRPRALLAGSGAPPIQCMLHSFLQDSERVKFPGFLTLCISEVNDHSPRRTAMLVTPKVTKILLEVSKISRFFILSGNQ